MAEQQGLCFVMMPFSGNLHYFYLYLKHHVEAKYGLLCERADEQVLTVPVLDKINAYIQEADVIIADATGKNANVFYELGIAHAYGKKVILITQDYSEAPSDVRHFEFISYDLGKHVEFLEKLDNALHNVLFEGYQELYEAALRVLQRFRGETGMRLEAPSREDFLGSVRSAERTEPIPSLEDEYRSSEFLLPRIVASSDDAVTMRHIVDWLRTVQATDSSGRAG